ncbi:MAG: hypothetical protein WC998_04120, partial [Candidatus Paceibacterota bacterium]
SVEENGKVFMENKDIGLKFMVPEGWEVISTDVASLSMHSPDFIPFTEPSFIPKNGCWIDVTPKIQVEGSNYDLQYSDLKQEIEDESYLSHENTEKKKCDIMELFGIKGIRCNLSIDENINSQGNYIYFSIPYNNVVYRFETHIFGQDKEKCLQDFDNFLSTIFIKKK